MCSGEGRLLQHITLLCISFALWLDLLFVNQQTAGKNWREAHSWHHWSMFLVYMKYIVDRAWVCLLMVCHLAISEATYYLPYVADGSWELFFCLIKNMHWGKRILFSTCWSQEGLNTSDEYCKMSTVESHTAQRISVGQHVSHCHLILQASSWFLGSEKL